MTTRDADEKTLTTIALFQIFRQKHLYMLMYRIEIFVSFTETVKIINEKYNRNEFRPLTTIVNDKEDMY